MSVALSTEQRRGSLRQTLIVGVGNRLMGDEGIGPHIVDDLSHLPMPPDVRVLDCGCDLLNLVSYIDKPRKIVVVDAVRAGAKPGQIHRFDCSDFEFIQTKTHSAHQFQIGDALRLLKQVCPCLADCEITVIGIEPKEIRLGTDLSKEVTASIADLTRLVLAPLETRRTQAPLEARRTQAPLEARRPQALTGQALTGLAEISLPSYAARHLAAEAT